MRILFLGNNRLASEIVTWLREQGEQIVGLVLHPREERKFGEEIISGSGVAESRVFDGSQLGDPAVANAIRETMPEMGVSVHFGRILKKSFLDMLPRGCINLHPGLLPYNRGAYPNVWSIVEGTPAGTTLHYMDEGVDTGEIIVQREVVVEPTDTGESLYRRLSEESAALFRESWPLIRSGKEARVRQIRGEGSYHRVEDVKKIDEIDLDKTFRAGDLIDILRARTFPPFTSAYFNNNGRKVYLRIQFLSEEDLEREQSKDAGH